MISCRDREETASCSWDGWKVYQGKKLREGRSSEDRELVPVNEEHFIMCHKPASYFSTKLYALHMKSLFSGLESNSEEAADTTEQNCLFVWFGAPLPPAHLIQAPHSQCCVSTYSQTRCELMLLGSVLKNCLSLCCCCCS